MGPPSKYCQYGNCPTTSSDGKRMFRFPKDPQRCKLWLAAAKNLKLSEKPLCDVNKNGRLCEDHFSAWCFMNATRTSKLVFNAIPDAENRPVKCYRPSNEAEIDHFVVPEDPVQESSCVSATLSSNSPLLLGASNSDLSTPCMPGPSCATPSNLCTKRVLCSKSSGRRKYSPRKAKMAKEIKKKSDCLRKCKEKTKLMNKLLSTYKKPKPSHVRQTLKNAKVETKLVNLIMRQVKLNTTSRQGRRFTISEKLFAYNILCKSRAAFRVLKTVMELPSESTLKRFIASKLSKPGINHNVIESIGKCLQDKPLAKRVFALVFDEISIKPRLLYNAIEDNVSGFEDFGEQGGRTMKIANQALVFMIRSLQGKQKLPICYYYSHGSVTGDYLKLMVQELVEKLEKNHADIRVLICDQVSTNCRLFKMLGITKRSPYYLQNAKRMYGIYDPPHLLKTFRRNFMKYDLVTPKGIFQAYNRFL